MNGLHLWKGPSDGGFSGYLRLLALSLVWKTGLSILKTLGTTASRHLATVVGIHDTVKFKATLKRLWELVLGIPSLWMLSKMASARKCHLCYW